MKKYVILHGFSAEGLEEKVQESVNNGWELAGGVSVAMHEEYEVWAQAMVKEEEEVYELTEEGKQYAKKMGL